jgi:hypothetical protein
MEGRFPARDVSKLAVGVPAFVIDIVHAMVSEHIHEVKLVVGAS